MNEQALQDSFKLFQSQGYSGDINAYKELISTNDEAFNDAYSLFSNSGYKGGEGAFKSLMGVNVVGKTNDSAVADPNAESNQEDTGSKSEDGSSESAQEDKTFLGGLKDYTLSSIKMQEYVTNPAGAILKDTAPKIKSVFNFLGGAMDDIKSRIVDEEVIVPENSTGAYLAGRGFSKDPEVFIDSFTTAVKPGAPGFVGTLYKQIVDASKDFEEAAYILGAGLYLQAKAGKTELTSEERKKIPELIRNAIAVKDMAFRKSNIGALSGMLGKFNKKDIQKVSDNLADKQIQYDNTISEEMAKGLDANWGEIGGRIVAGAVTSAPYTIMSMDKRSAAFLGIGIAADKFIEEIEQDPDRAHWKLLGNATTTGAIEMADALIQRRLFRAKGLLPGKKKAAEKAVKEMNKGIGRKLLDMAGIGVKEGLTEMGQAFFTKVADYAWLDELPGQDEDGNVTKKGLRRTFNEMLDEGIIGAFSGGGVASVAQMAQGNETIKRRAESLLMPNSVRNEINADIKKYRERELEAQKAQKEGNNRRAGALRGINKNLAVKIQRMKLTGRLVVENLTQEELTEYAKNLDKITALENGGDIDGQVSNDIKTLQDQNNELFQGALKRNFGENMSFTQAAASQLGLDAVIAKDINEFNELIGTSKGKTIRDKDGVAGAFVGGGKFIINKETALKQGDVTVGSHEVLHPILNAMVGDSKAQQTLVEDFKRKLNRRERNWTEEEIFRKLGKDVLQNEDGSYKSRYYTEYITTFSEGLVNDNINFDSNVFEKILDFLTKLYKRQGFDNINFKDGRGVYNFMKAYAGSVKDGKLSQEVIDAIDPKKVAEVQAEGDLQASQTQLAQAKERLGAIPASEVDSRANVNKIAQELPNMISTQINNRFAGLDPSTLEEFTFDVLTKVISPNKQGVNKDMQWDGRGDLYGFLNGRIKLRIADAVREDYNRPSAERLYVGRIDAKQLEDLTKEPSTEPTVETPALTKKTTEESVERGQATFDQLEVVDDTLVEDVKNDLEKELRVRAQKGTLSEMTEVKRNGKIELISWLESYINKKLFKNLSKRLGAIGEKNGNVIIPPAYIDFLQSQKTFDIITKALSIKSIKKSYSRLFSIEKIGREETAEGNPIFRIKKIDKTKFFKYFVDGKKSTILERQKQLFREILTPVAKQAIADYATPQNISTLKSIQELAPAESADVVNKVALQAQLENLESQIDRYKGEEKSFDIIQFSQTKFTPSEQKLIKKISGSNATGDLATVELIVKLIKALISPTKTDLNGKFNQLKEELGIDLYNKIYDNYLAPMSEAFTAMSDTSEYGRGIAAERFAYDVIKKIPGIKMISKKATGEPGSDRGDIVIEISKTGQQFTIEVKNNKTARITSLNIHNYTNTPSYSRSPGKSNEKIIAKAVAGSKPLQDFIKRVKAYMKKEGISEKEYLTPNGSIQLTPEEMDILFEGSVDKKGKFSNTPYSNSIVYMPLMNESVVENIYNNKGVYNIGFLDLGFFYVGKNAGNFNIPKFTGKLKTRAWFKVEGIKSSNGRQTLTLRTYFELNSDSSAKLAKKSNTSFASSASMKKAMFSQTKNTSDPFGMIDVVSGRLYKDSNGRGIDFKNLNEEQKQAVREEMSANNLDKIQLSQRNISNLNKARLMANRVDAPRKGISVWDFDDTLATTKSKVLYTMPDGTKGSIDATEFALKGGNLADSGAEFDFSEFEKVMQGAKGPMFEKAVARNEKFGNENVFILTARPANSKYAIHEFLNGIGLNIKLDHIIGLGDGTATAKAQWVIGKVAEGYNDFYFADDAYKNVQAVQEVLEQADVKSKVHQAKVQFNQTLNKEFNKIIEETTGIDANKTFSDAKARVLGEKKGRFDIFIPPGAEDFAGLLYKLTGKGKQGEAHQAWFKQSLFDPFAQAINDFESYKQNVTAIVNQLKKQIKNVPAGLKKVNDTGFTNEQAVRVYLWARNGYDIPGLSKQDQKELIDIVSNNPALMDFADTMDAALGGYPAPQEQWLAGTITTDAINQINTAKRAEFLQQWQENVDVIFSKENINKLRSKFGDSYVEALQDMLYRMRTGRNRPSGANKTTNKWLNWVNNSVGTIMFFNTRSALLQTLSIVNFVNWGDNNPIQAAKAFANQKQFWSDFAMLFNSDFLKQRRSGLKNDVNADDIANAAETSTNKARAVLSSLLKMGFLPTQIADSFAIAMGGASFIRNRIDSYVKEGLSKQEAEQKAFLDFQEIAEETQQSSRPDRVSAQQAGSLGRIILAFANTPMQYMRLTKKAFLDLKNGRGDAKTNISKIMYYMAVQNVIFSSLQAALFASLFEDDDEEAIENKQLRTANSMLDSILRGTGLYGSVVSTIKNIVLEIDKQSKKPRPDYTVAAQRALSISPPIDSKMRKIMSAARAFSYKTTRAKMKGFSLENPAIYAVSQIISAATNVPLDRAVRKADNIRLAVDNETKFWQSFFLFAGFSAWDLGLVETSKSKKKKKLGDIIKHTRPKLTKKDLLKK